MRCKRTGKGRNKTWSGHGLYMETGDSAWSLRGADALGARAGQQLVHIPGPCHSRMSVVGFGFVHRVNAASFAKVETAVDPL